MPIKRMMEILIVFFIRTPGIIDAKIPVVIGGSVLSARDEREVLAKGVAAAFGPGSSSDEIVTQLRELAGRRHEATRQQD